MKKSRLSEPSASLLCFLFLSVSFYIGHFLSLSCSRYKIGLNSDGPNQPTSQREISTTHTFAILPQQLGYFPFAAASAPFEAPCTVGSWNLVLLLLNLDVNGCGAAEQCAWQPTFVRPLFWFLSCLFFFSSSTTLFFPFLLSSSSSCFFPWFFRCSRLLAPLCLPRGIF